MEFGPEIKVDGKRPEWLKDATKIVVNDDSVTDPGTVYGSYASGRGWKDIRKIRLPANHPHYNLTIHTYTVRPEDEAALLASDPLSRSTPDERAVALVKWIAGRGMDNLPYIYTEARAILAALEPVDGDLVEARKIALQFACPAEYSKGTSYRTMEGDYDNADYMNAIKAALARGRQLEKEGK